jgi:hypothetical protein
MTRQTLIELILRQVYGEQPSDDSSITDNLVNVWINQGIGIAAKKNYTDSIQIDGIAYMNNSFYTTFSGLAITKDTTESFTYYVTLPEVPVGIGRNEGVATVRFKNTLNSISNTGIPLSINQEAFADNLRTIPNKTLYYPQGSLLKIKSALLLDSGYTCIVKMVSGGDSTDLSSTINVPPDYIPIVVDYVQKQLMLQRAQPKDLANDGEDLK